MNAIKGTHVMSQPTLSVNFGGAASRSVTCFAGRRKDGRRGGRGHCREGGGRVGLVDGDEGEGVGELQGQRRKRG